MERRRLKTVQDVIVTGELTWHWCPPTIPAYQDFNVLMYAPHPGGAAAYVIKYVGHKVGDRTLYLFRTLHDDRSQYLGCEHERKLEKLCQLGEELYKGPSQQGEDRDERGTVRQTERVTGGRTVAPSKSNQRTLF